MSTETFLDPNADRILCDVLCDVFVREKVAGSRGVRLLARRCYQHSDVRAGAASRLGGAR